MNQLRVLDAVWSTCDELARLERNVASIRWNADSILREACTCILASQVPHEMTLAAVQRLAKERLLPTTQISPREVEITDVLRTPLSLTYPRAYRFPSQAARRLRRLAAVADEVVDLVFNSTDATEARRALIATKCGLGAKQASLLLRNVRVEAELAVLDVHILEFMRVIGLASDNRVPVRLAQYEILESRFCTYAYGLRIPVRRLDVAAWIVMRIVRAKEFSWQ